MSPWGKFILENCDQVDDCLLLAYYKVCEACTDEYMIRQLMNYSEKIGVNIYYPDITFYLKGIK